MRCARTREIRSVSSRTGAATRARAVPPVPTVPQKAAGRRTLPPVSVPTAQGSWKEATDTPEPLELPPGTRCVKVSGYVHGLTGVPIR